LIEQALNARKVVLVDDRPEVAGLARSQARPEAQTEDQAEEVKAPHHGLQDI
jgi:hypothetical protein